MNRLRWLSLSMNRLLWLSILCLCLLAACADSSTSEVVSWADLVDYPLVGKNGSVVGRVEDVLVNSTSGQISYAVVELPPAITPFHGLAPKDSSGGGEAVLLAIPWRFLSLDVEAHQLSVAVDAAVLYDAPRLTQDIDDLEAGWDESVKAYWEADRR
jgi:sporulation protein YlmC with PRC-barrel domain